MSENEAEKALASILGNQRVYHLKRDFGAVGDGIADDTGAWKKSMAVQNRPGTTVFVPAGRYRLRSPDGRYRVFENPQNCELNVAIDRDYREYYPS